jgi:hypothetical protein
VALAPVYGAMAGEVTSVMLTAALFAAADFGDVLPLSPGRKPLVTFDRATSEPEAIAALWQEHPGAGVGVAAWSARLIELDVEHPGKGHGDGRDTLARLERQIGPLPPTRTHATKTGGLHLVFALPPGATLRSAHCLIRGEGIAAPGLDIIAGRAVLRWPPTPGYTIERTGAGHTMDGAGGAALLPERWIRALSDPPTLPVSRVVLTAEDRGRRYVLAALERESVAIAAVSAGRNTALTRSAFRLGQLCPSLRLDEIEASLMLASKANGSIRDHGARVCLSTIRRQVMKGSQIPRFIETTT